MFWNKKKIVIEEPRTVITGFVDYERKKKNT